MQARRCGSSLTASLDGESRPRCGAYSRHFPTRFFHRGGPGGRGPNPCALQGRYCSKCHWNLCSRCVASCLHYPTQDSSIGEGLEAEDRIRVPVKDFTGPGTVGLFVPDAERIVVTLAETILPSRRTCRHLTISVCPLRTSLLQVPLGTLLQNRSVLSATSRHDSTIGEGLEAGRLWRDALQGLHYSTCR